jgi:hypothetical protein
METRRRPRAASAATLISSSIIINHEVQRQLARTSNFEHVIPRTKSHKTHAQRSEPQGLTRKNIPQPSLKDTKISHPVIPLGFSQLFIIFAALLQAYVSQLSAVESVDSKTGGRGT